MITIDGILPAPRINLRPARGMLIPELTGIPGQTCALSYSTDLIHWSAPQIYTLSTTPISFAAVSASAPTHFYRVTQSLPLNTDPGVMIGVQMQQNFGGNIPTPPVPPLP